MSTRSGPELPDIRDVGAGVWCVHGVRWRDGTKTFAVRQILCGE